MLPAESSSRARGSGHVASGTLVSNSIPANAPDDWGILSYTDDVSGNGTALTMDVLDSTGALLAANVASGTDLSTLPAVANASSIELRANLSTTNPANTPLLTSWSVSYYRNNLSGWSDYVGSTQGTAPVITSGTPLTSMQVNTAFTFTYTATGLPAPLFSVASGALPTGLALSSDGIISGTPSAPGTYAGTVSAANILAGTTQPFTFTVFNTFGNWTTQHFTAQQLTDPTISGPTATPQNDGVPNLLKYLLDIDPSQPMTTTDRAAVPIGSIFTNNGSTFLGLTYRQSPLSGGITVNIQTSPDTINWLTVTPDLTQTVSTDQTTGDPIIRVGINVNGASQKYIRLNVGQSSAGP